MGRKKKEKTVIHSIRVNEDMKSFLKSLDNANLFVLQLLEETEDYKKYIRFKKELENLPSLFD